jgi:hypothetical protein
MVSLTNNEENSCMYIQQDRMKWLSHAPHPTTFLSSLWKLTAEAYKQRIQLPSQNILQYFKMCVDIVG